MLNKNIFSEVLIIFVRIFFLKYCVVLITQPKQLKTRVVMWLKTLSQFQAKNNAVLPHSSIKMMHKCQMATVKMTSSTSKFSTLWPKRAITLGVRIYKMFNQLHLALENSNVLPLYLSVLTTRCWRNVKMGYKIGANFEIDVFLVLFTVRQTTL